MLPKVSQHQIAKLAMHQNERKFNAHQQGPHIALRHDIFELITHGLLQGCFPPNRKVYMHPGDDEPVCSSRQGKHQHFEAEELQQAQAHNQVTPCAKAALVTVDEVSCCVEAPHALVAPLSTERS